MNISPKRMNRKQDINREGLVNVTSSNGERPVAIPSPIAPLEQRTQLCLCIPMIIMVPQYYIIRQDKRKQRKIQDPNKILCIATKGDSYGSSGLTCIPGFLEASCSIYFGK